MINILTNVTVNRLTPPNKDCFFGYYDKCPWSRDERRIITGIAKFNNRSPVLTDVLEIGFLDTHINNSFHLIGETTAWNFQQGAMAQWFNICGSEHILYNKTVGDKVQAFVTNISGSLVKSLHRPVYALSLDCNYAASIDFSRLHEVRPGYGYEGVGTVASKHHAPDSDGLWLINLETEDESLLVSYHTLANDISPRGLNSYHWIDHIEFSPDSSWIVFLHRWIAADGGPLTRLMSFHRESRELLCLLDCGSSGHGVWLDSSHYGIWGRRSSLAAKARSSPARNNVLKQIAIRLARHIIPPAIKSQIHQDTFFSFNVKDRSSADVQPQIPSMHRQGHPSLRPCGDWLVSDTLPDSRGRRTLFLSSLDGKRYIPLLTVTHPVHSVNSPFRCDLHPRWDRSGQLVCIDSLHEGFRAMYSVDISSLNLTT
jgi:hypothetical protein